MSPSELWARTLKILKRSVNTQIFEAWFTHTRCVAVSAEGVRIQVPNQFFADWLKDHHLTLIRESLAEALDSAPPAVDFSVSEQPTQRPNTAPPLPAPRRPVEARPKSRNNHCLNERFSFSSFVVGQSNQFANAAAQAVAENPAHVYNPLFVYGGVGLGKTHILQAIGNRVVERDPLKNVFYVSAEHFMNEMIHSIQTGTTLLFKEKYRTVDLLLIDDVQFLAGKESTQEEFFHTFNTLYQSQKQIVLTSDRPPKEITNLEERLVSRFEWGLIADIQPPDLETRIAILRKKSESDSLSIPDDVLQFIAGSIRSNIREIEGSLVRLLAFSSLTGQDISIDMAREVLKDFLSRRSRKATIPQIQKVAAADFSVPENSMVSKRRTADIAFARQVAMHIARELTGLSLNQIGARFGGRDHTTVLHACQKVERMIGADDDFRLRVDRMVEEITS